MKIRVISVGKIKEKFFVKAIDEYAKRLSKYCKLDMLEVADEKCPETLSDKQMILVKDKEAERILSKINDTDYVITLEIKGKELSSEGFAKHISDLALQGKSNVCFVIGGSLGLSDKILERSNYALSFSNMTFPHQLMKVILLEQIYRAFRIINGHSYHK